MFYYLCYDNIKDQKVFLHSKYWKKNGPVDIRVQM